ncbi:knirps-related protein-like isoform X3 [Sitodiplosis mosellana]|nr:knirps-related protein-like isoform X3 [Sitodiplosis mosellana]
MVGMSKSGSRYGRRSNWFKIHCLLQEQQQQQQAAAAAAAAGNRKTPPSSSSSINMLGHSNYPQSLYSRPTTKEELMLLGFEDYNNHNSKRPSASPSVSSPDSHNSDSSVEVGDRRQSLLRQSQAQHQQNRGQLPPPPFNKELFLPLSFPGLMPPPGFLPPSHLMFPGYHPALYAQHQGLLKPAVDSVALLSSAQSMANNNSRFVPNNNCGSKSAEELTKRYLDAVLKSQCSPNDNNSTKSEDEDMENEDIVVSMTPPTSPPPPPASLRSTSSVSRLSNSTAATTSTLREKNITLPTAASSSSSSSPPSNRAGSQDAPIDLSMKSSSSGGTSAKAISPHMDHRDFGSDEDGAASSEEELSIDNRPSSDHSRPDSRNEHEKTIREHANGIRIKGTTPLDLTTKI